MKKNSYKFFGFGNDGKNSKILYEGSIKRFDELDQAEDVKMKIMENSIQLLNKKLIREIEVEEIESLTISKSSSEFLIHLFDEPDERISSVKNKNKILECLVYLKTNEQFSDGVIDKFPIYFVKDVNLDIYLTTEEDLEEGHTIRPEEKDMLMMDYKDYRKRI